MSTVFVEFWPVYDLDKCTQKRNKIERLYMLTHKLLVKPASYQSICYLARET